MAGEDCVTASGMPAAARPLTWLTPASAAPDAVRKVLRDNVMTPLLAPSVVAGFCARGRSGTPRQLRRLTASPANDGGVEIDGCQPEVPPCFDGLDVGGDARARLAQKREEVADHGVVVEHGLVGDDLAQGKDLALVVPRDVIGTAVGLVGFARLGASIDGPFEQAVDRSNVGFFRKPHASFAEVIDRDLDIELEAATLNLVDLGLPTAGDHVLFGLADAGGLESVDEARLAGEAELKCEDIDLHPGDDEVGSTQHGFLLD